MTHISLNDIKTSEFIDYIVNQKIDYTSEIKYLLPVFPKLVRQICNYLNILIKLKNPPKNCSTKINELITQSNLNAKNQNLIRVALNSYFQDRIKLGKILAGVEQIPSFSFKDSAGQDWQGACISLAGVHTLTNSDRIFAPENGSSILAAVADGVTNSSPPRKIKETDELYQTRKQELVNNPNLKFSYKSNLLGQKVADAVIKSLDDPTLDTQKISKGIPWSKFPEDTAGSCTLSTVHREKNEIHLQTIGDSPIFIFNKRKNKIYYTENTSGEVLTSSIRVERLQNQKKITFLKPERYNPININDIDWIMVASDGIFGTHHERRQVKTLLEQNKNKTPQEIIQEVLGSAHQKGSNDDISIVLVKPFSRLQRIAHAVQEFILLQPRANSNSFASYSSS